MRVLVVDDDPSLRSALRMVLEDAGHEVLLATTLDEAQARLESTPPDAALIDARLSGRGVAFWREIEADPRFAGRGVLLAGDPRVLGSLRDHPRAFAKPFDYGALLERLDEVVRRASVRGPRPPSPRPRSRRHPRRTESGS
jgi:DNA-binding response OmpR family regulator